MKAIRLLIGVFLAGGSHLGMIAQTTTPSFSVIAFYTERNDQAHISFVHEANQWFARRAEQYHFTYDSTRDWTQLNAAFLSHYQVVIFLDTRPDVPEQRMAFQKYMEGGGAWMGFHFSAFALTPSDFPQNWDWYHNFFLGSGAYVSNTWRPVSAIARVEDRTHPATRLLPETFKTAPSEWYRWSNDLRKNPDITVLVSIDSTSFPLGTGPKPSEIWHSGYYPIVWTNRQYKMIYFNMGHNDIDYEHPTDRELSSTFSSPVQDTLIIHSLLWLGKAYPSIGRTPKTPLFDSQTELEPWGNISGIRIGGQLVPFSSNIRVVGDGGAPVTSTGKEMQQPHYERQGLHQLVNTRIDSLYLKEDVEDLGGGVARVVVTATSSVAMTLGGIYFSLQLPADFPVGDTLQWVDSNGVHTMSPGTGLPVEIVIHTGDLAPGQILTRSIDLRAWAKPDHAPARLVLNASSPGRPFDGLGGNFRIQNLRTDPSVIDYNLAHLKVVWGRVEMPWRFWQPTLQDHPLDSAAAGRLHPAVQRAMLMAQRLNKMGIPLILTAWFPPDWAIQGTFKPRPGPDGVWGNPLDSGHLSDTYKSIADYLQCLKDQYGIAIPLFSFNEPDLGINVRMTGQQHDAFIKGLGAYLASRGLATKMLLGDNSDATTYDFIYPAMRDTAARPYIGAVSFHSWRGCDSTTLQKWAQAATRLHLPLIVGEGSIDAAASNYPAIFKEPTYALTEISLYLRLMAICQPASILQWQLTGDYSLLAGGGVFGDTGVLRPTQRFWNLKQLASMPVGLPALSLSTDHSDIATAALGDSLHHRYVFHLVNNGPDRDVILTGLPPTIKTLRIYTTTANVAMQEGPPVLPTGGEARFILPAESFVTLFQE